MYYCLLLLTLAASAHAENEYIEARFHYEHGETMLYKYLYKHKDIDSFQKNLLVLKAVASGLADLVVLGFDYDSNVDKLLDVAALVGKTLPVYVKELSFARNKLVEEGLVEINALIRQCRSSLGPGPCNDDVVRAVKENPAKYKKPADLLLALSDLYEYALPGVPNILKAAKSADPLSLVRNKKQELKTLVYKLAKVYKLLL